MKWRTSDKAFPLLALGFNHRAESFYRCDAQEPANVNVIDARKRGLRKVRVLHWQTPDVVVQKVVSLLNQFHEGSAENHFDVMAEVGGPIKNLPEDPLSILALDSCTLIDNQESIV